VRQAIRVVHVPAVAHVRRAGVHQNEAVAVGVRGELGPAEPLLPTAAAGVELFGALRSSARRGAVVGVGVGVGRVRRLLTATMMAGLAATLSGT
jgi:hypothetical protein